MNNVIDREFIIIKIKDILKENFEIDFVLPDDFLQIPLTTQPFMFNAIQLYELLMIVEKSFRRYFSSVEIKENGFSTIDDIIRLIQHHDAKSSA